MNLMIETVGWVLLHSLWQASCIAAVVWVALRFIRVSAAEVRYLVSCTALLLMFLTAVATGILHWDSLRLSVAADRNGYSASFDRSHAEAHAPTAGIPQSHETKSVAGIVDTKSMPDQIHEHRNSPPSNSGRTDSQPLQKKSFSSWPKVVVGIWAAGVLILSLRVLKSWSIVRHLRATAVPNTDATYAGMFEKLLQQLGVRQAVELLAIDADVVPMVVGWIRPAVILPASLVSGLPATHVEAILAHEIAHVRRHDFLVNLLQNALETLFFFHPAVWWLSARIRQEREHCCDDIAANLSGSAVEYSRALTALEEFRGISPAAAASAAGGSLFLRIQRLLNADSHSSHSRTSLFAAIAGFLFLAGIGAAAVLIPIDQATLQESSQAKTAEAPDHPHTSLLIRHWEQLEGAGGVLPETSANGLREAIDSWILSGEYSQREIEQLKQLRGWHQGRAQHSVEDLAHWLNAVAAVRAEPLQLAISNAVLHQTDSQAANAPRRGRLYADLQMAKYQFGPANRQGMRVALHIVPAKKKYVFGDVVSATLLIWNTSDTDVRFTHNWQDNGLSPLPGVDLEATGTDGRNIRVKALRTKRTSEGVCWLVKPQEVVSLSGYRLRIGPGKPRESLSFWGWPGADGFHSHEIKGLQSKETFTLHARLASLVNTENGQPYSPIMSGRTKAQAFAVEDVEAWATNRAGHWKMSNGATLEIHRNVVHAADVMTTAILHWPAKDGQPGEQVTLNVAADAFGNREPWAVAWDDGSSQLWIASSRIGQPVTVAQSLRCVDFSDRTTVLETHYSGWPTTGGPSPACVAAMDDLLPVKPVGQLQYRAVRTSTPSESSRVAGNELEISVVIRDVDGLCDVDLNRGVPLKHLSQALKNASARTTLRWKTNGTRRAFAAVRAGSAIPDELLRTVLKICNQADLRPEPLLSVPTVSEDEEDPVLTITRAGKHRINDLYEVVVNTDRRDGKLRNELLISRFDGNGQVHRCALPYGTGTWAVGIRRPAEEDKSISIAVASAKGVFGLDDLPIGRLGTFWKVSPKQVAAKSYTAAAEPWESWVSRIHPNLRPESRKLIPAAPKFEVRLVSEDSEEPEIIRRQPYLGAGVERERFVSLGRLILVEKDVSRAELGFIQAGMVTVQFNVNEDRKDAFAEICRKHAGRQAALVQDGQVWNVFTLMPGIKSISTPYIGAADNSQQ